MDLLKLKKKTISAIRQEIFVTNYYKALQRI